MLKEGERAPEFTLPDDTGRDRSLTDFLNSGATVLYIYPDSIVPGSTSQACQLRDLQGELDGANLRVVGMSPERPDTNAKFRAKHRLPFSLLSDVDKEVFKMYGLIGPFGFVRRTTFLIDSSRRILDAVVADLNIGRHLDLVRKAILGRSKPS